MSERVTPKPLPPTNLPPLKQVGKPLRRVDAMGKAVGATVYAGDFSMPNMLHAKVFRSPVPSARIVHLDVSKARALPGVACVLTGADLPNAKLATDMPGQTGRAQRKGSDAPVLATDVVRFHGEPIALVAAETLAIAEAALELIELKLEKLPGVFDPQEALKPDAPRVYADASDPVGVASGHNEAAGANSASGDPSELADRNVVARWKIRKGNLERGMAEADLVVENTYRVPFVEHAYMEPDAGVGWIDEQGVINLRICTQVVEHFRTVAKALGIPQNRVRVQGTMVGGGFGSKEDVTVEIYLALLAQATGRPVKLVYTREEAFLATSKRHPFTITHRTGVKRTGRITASEIKMTADSGAYPYLTPYVLLYATGMAAGPYKIDNVHVDSVAAATNQPFTSAFRGFGGPQAAFAYESQMDEIARVLMMDPLEVRRINYLKTGDTTVTGQKIRTAAWSEECVTRAIAALGERTPSTETRKIGRGFASYFQSYGRITWFHDTSRAWVGMELDGTVVIRCGVPDIGAGQSNSLCQIAAEVLGVPLERVTVYATDSAVTPLAGTSTATRQLYMSGNAVLQAAGVVRASLVKQAAEMLGVTEEQVDLADGKAFVVRGARAEGSQFAIRGSESQGPGAPGSTEKAIPLAEVAAKAAASGLPAAMNEPGVSARGNSRARSASDSPQSAHGEAGWQETGRRVPLAEVASRCAAAGLPLANLAQFNAPFTDGLDPETGQGDI
ncbi:MAG: xanthine dehydrogenase family protein molybdopterin-binding subunit, partial [Candidatus Bipolaricaulota bacterium]|nr:xanthine dehydrogenase family protein molybdopterin-binding subunit [Candidatus Bipolaricaulota bacterium]